jgi:hypothetical protein
MKTAAPLRGLIDRLDTDNEVTSLPAFSYLPHALSHRLPA